MGLLLIATGIVFICISLQLIILTKVICEVRFYVQMVGMDQCETNLHLTDLRKLIKNFKRTTRGEMNWMGKMMEKFVNAMIKMNAIRIKKHGKN